MKPNIKPERSADQRAAEAAVRREHAANPIRERPPGTVTQHGFSAILNLGLLARQRVQVLPMLFVLIAGLAWDETKRGSRRKKTEPEAAPESIESEVDKVLRTGPSRKKLPATLDQ